jgi:hypothetical protein
MAKGKKKQKSMGIFAGGRYRVKGHTRRVHTKASKPVKRVKVKGYWKK